METNSRWTLTFEQATKAHRGEQMYSSTVFLTSVLDGGVGGQHHAPAALPPGKTLYPLYRRGSWGSTAGLHGQGKFRPPPGIDLRTVQPVVSRYTDFTIPVHSRA
jgi:hypothetical protein